MAKLGSKWGIVHCAYCKKEVLWGMDSTIYKSGRNKGQLMGRHNSCNKEIQALNIQYAHLLLGNKCKCCGSTKNIQAGHINFPKDKIMKDKRRNTGFKVWSGDNIANPKFLKLIETHAVIPVCGSCNMSMGNGSTCRVHNHYMGVWNHLPHIDDLESLPYYKALEEVNNNETQTRLQ